MNKTIYSTDHSILVKKLIKARKEKNMKQEEVAKILQKSQSYISKIESGQRRIDIIQLKEFSKIYKKDLNYFLKD